MLGLLAFVKTADAQVRLDLDNELEEAFFASRSDVLSILQTRHNKEGNGFHRHGHIVTYVFRELPAKLTCPVYQAVELWLTCS